MAKAKTDSQEAKKTPAKKAASSKKRPASKALNKAAEPEMKKQNAEPEVKEPTVEKTEEEGWARIAEDLAPYAKLFERWHIKAISAEEYAEQRGCFDTCNLDGHEATGHHEPTDGYPPLLVTYSGENGVTHRRHDGSRQMPSYIFSPAMGGAVKVTDPFDKFAYIRRAMANPEIWDVAFEEA